MAAGLVPRCAESRLLLLSLFITILLSLFLFLCLKPANSRFRVVCLGPWLRRHIGR